MTEYRVSTDQDDACRNIVAALEKILNEEIEKLGFQAIIGHSALREAANEFLVDLNNHASHMKARAKELREDDEDGRNIELAYSKQIALLMYWLNKKKPVHDARAVKSDGKVAALHPVDINEHLTARIMLKMTKDAAYGGAIARIRGNEFFSPKPCFGNCEKHDCFENYFRQCYGDRDEPNGNCAKNFQFLVYALKRDDLPWSTYAMLVDQYLYAACLTNTAMPSNDERFSPYEDVDGNIFGAEEGGLPRR